MNVAFIPVRGGSKSIPLKNIKPIAGKPLVYWTIKAACGCEKINLVYVATDSEEIQSAIEDFCQKEGKNFEKVKVIGRSSETASDTATTESAMLEFAQKYEFDNIVLIQATSPLLSSEDLERGFRCFEAPDTDSVLSVVRQKRFVWHECENGIVQPANYDYSNRPRRQEFSGYLVENGAFYITSSKALCASKNRLSGSIRAVEMDDASYHEIDEPEDWIIIEELLKRKLKREQPQSNDELKSIKLFLTDCDGCLTDGGMYYSENGDELKKFNTRDGVGFKLLKERGILTGMITGESVKLNRRRAEKLQLDIFEAGCNDKLEKILELCAHYGVELNEVCYVGDDYNDIEAIRSVGFGCCPADATPEVRAVASFVASSRGGAGVIREVAEKLLNF